MINPLPSPPPPIPVRLARGRRVRRGRGVLCPGLTSSPAAAGAWTEGGPSLPQILRNTHKSYDFNCILVLRIRIRMFLGLPDPHPDPLVTSKDPASGTSISSNISMKILDFYSFVTWLFFIFEKWCTRKWTSIPDPHPDPYKNVTAKQHWL